jgi:glycosyltransferase involved in cell wall biosynthesis
MTVLHSIVTPTCNRPVQLERAIQSVLSQKDPCFELLIVDDGIAPTAQSITKLCDPRISFLRTERPMSGPGISRNIALRIARGALITFLDDDDFLGDDFLNEVAFFHKKYDTPTIATVSNAIVRYPDHHTVTNNENLQTNLGAVFF